MKANKTVTVSKDVLIEAYNNGDERDKMLLERIYGEKMFQNVMERVKDFYTAYIELGEKHPLVKEYSQAYDAWRVNKFQYQKDALAYLRLRIVVAALNEGWKPKFTEDEKRYYPYFFSYTQKQIQKMSKNERANVFIFKNQIGQLAGIAYANSYNVPSGADTLVGSLICFKNRELADYAGKQFIWLYADYFA